MIIIGFEVQYLHYDALHIMIMLYSPLHLYIGHPYSIQRHMFTFMSTAIIIIAIIKHSTVRDLDDL